MGKKKCNCPEPLPPGDYKVTLDVEAYGVPGPKNYFALTRDVERLNAELKLTKDKYIEMRHSWYASSGDVSALRTQLAQALEQLDESKRLVVTEKAHSLRLYRDLKFHEKALEQAQDLLARTEREMGRSRWTIFDTIYSVGLGTIAALIGYVLGGLGL